MSTIAGRPALAVVADPQDLAVADVPDDAGAVAQPGDPQRRPPRRCRPSQPVSTRSPTPYWSSRIMKMPDRKSLTSSARRSRARRRRCRRWPAAARSAARARRGSSEARRRRCTPVVMLRSTDDIVSARCLRRSDSSGLAEQLGRRGPWRARRATVPSAAPAAIRRMTPVQDEPDDERDRRRMTRIGSGFASSQSDDSASHCCRSRRRPSRRTCRSCLSSTQLVSRSRLDGVGQLRRAARRR